MTKKQKRWLEANKKLLHEAYLGCSDGSALWWFDSPNEDDCGCCGFDHPPGQECLMISNDGALRGSTGICLLCAVLILERWRTMAEELITNLNKNIAETQEKMMKSREKWVGRAVQH